MRRQWLAIITLLVVAAAIAIAAGVVRARRRSLPPVGTDAYTQATRHFYRGLAELQVGLIDAAVADFTHTASVAPGEPAAWANLGLTHLRLGAFDAAASAIERATALAADDSDIAFLAGRLESTRGRRGEAIVQFRRAIDLAQMNLRARSALIQALEDAGTPEADADAARALEDLLARQPRNPAVLIERARLAAKRNDAATLRDAVARLDSGSPAWPADVADQYRALKEDTQASRFADAARDVAFLRNLLTQVPSFLDERRLIAPSAELIAEPFATFLRLAPPVSTPSPADTALRLTIEPVGAVASNAVVLAMSLDGDQPPTVLAASVAGVHRVEAGGSSTTGRTGPLASLSYAAALDWNHDFRMDVVTADENGVHLFVQSANGAFDDDTARASGGAPPLHATGIWPADLEMDGDLDVVVGAAALVPVVLRNNGDGTWRVMQPFAGVIGARGFAWGDVDRDGDPDAVFVDGDGALHVLSNLQAGRFQAIAAPPHVSGIRAVAIGDLDADGVLDVVTLDAAGAIRRAEWTGPGWTEQQVASWRAPGSDGGARVLLADLDNNGALDVIASDAGGTGVWLTGEDRAYRPLNSSIDAEISGVGDLNGDGMLDLIGRSGDRALRLIGRGTRGYHFQIVRPRALRVAGDQRINTFGIGGEIEARSGEWAEKQVITDTSIHIGLGARAGVDVIRIVWPNGVPQAEFDPKADQAIVAEQRLKGSCPWVFADDGTGVRFVTDFLWRSPLGLRINAQDTAGVTQTEDWVRIRGDQLAPRAGAYDLRITAELWETHFVDYTALLTVDHPADAAIFVDERFARTPPALAVQATHPPHPIARAWDQDGRDVTDVVNRLDGRALDTFARGAYQGVAADHFVEFELGAGVRLERPMWLVAQGWIYPTDSSINVAIGQGAHDAPRGVSLEAEDARGRWIVVSPDLGFPAGKNKTMLVDLSSVARAGVADARRLRLRTNLEIYWDALSYAEPWPDAPVRTTRIAASAAVLRYRGFSVTSRERRDQPELPIYDRIANTAPRWRDLVGVYTRFGDVRELLAGVDDRYVIMNAGDELRLSFPALAAPDRGWTRDFVLIGDGWEKDGDYNTGFSSTVLPLPAHGHPQYGADVSTMDLSHDQVFEAHPDDWHTFHTRFVTPAEFLRGLTLRPPPHAP